MNKYNHDQKTLYQTSLETNKAREINIILAKALNFSSATL